MKKILCLAVVLNLLGATSVLCAERFDATAWRDVQTYDVPTLKKIEESLIGKVVGVRFNYRHAKIRHLKPSWYQGSLWSFTPGEKKRFTYLRVVVPKAALPAFETITTDFKSRAELVVYGKVQKDADANFLFIRLIGRNVTLDRSGDAVVDW